ncbi:hypothetical protein ACLBWP_10265 [Microbacterium sp. M1A1_1b]
MTTDADGKRDQRDTDDQRDAVDLWRELRGEESDDRWAEMDRRLDGLLADDRPRPRPDRRRRRRWVVIVLAIVVLGVALGWVIGSFPGEDASDTSTASSSSLREVIALAGLGIAITVWVTGVVLRVRRHQPLFSFREPTTVLLRAERRAVERTIRGRAPVDPEHRWTLRRLAVARLEQTQWTLWLFGGWLPLSIGQAANGWGAWNGSLYSVLAVLWAALLVVATLQRSRWRAFIAAHPATEPTYRG